MKKSRNSKNELAYKNGSNTNHPESVCTMPGKSFDACCNSFKTSVCLQKTAKSRNSKCGLSNVVPSMSLCTNTTQGIQILIPSTKNFKYFSKLSKGKNFNGGQIFKTYMQKSKVTSSKKKCKSRNS